MQRDSRGMKFELRNYFVDGLSQEIRKAGLIGI